MSEPEGLDRGLTNYGDREFAAYLRRTMARSMGISRELLGKPVVGIATSPSGFNNCLPLGDLLWFRQFKFAGAVCSAANSSIVHVHFHFGFC